MPISNSYIADLFEEVANLLEIQAASPFRVNAYRNAARVVRGWPVSLSSLAVQSGDRLPKMPGLGADLSGKVLEVIKTRHLSLLDRLREEIPPGLVELLKVPGIGPRRVALLREHLGVESLSGLGRAVEEGRLKEVPGFGPVLEGNVRREVTRLQGRTQGERPRMKLAEAEQAALPLLEYFRTDRDVRRAEIAGSFRRRLETVGDLDLLVTGAPDRVAAILARFVREYPDIEEVVSRGGTRVTVRLSGRLQVDIRAVDEESYGAALHYFTGSKAHNIAVRRMGIERGLKINEYGVFRGRRRVGGRSEEEVFASVGLPWIDPEIRENEGEIECARSGELPRLVVLEEIRGDLHAHTSATDGRRTIREMAEAARAQGYEYLGITDHTRRLTVARGLDPRRLVQQIREIDRLNEEEFLPGGFRILKGSEVDILEDGGLDLPDSILERLDYTVCSVHSAFSLSARRQTERILRAMENPHFSILGHPTTRLIDRRAPMDFDLERVLRTAGEVGCFVELNAQPERMDLAAAQCRLAREMGVGVVISTDAHSEHDLGWMRFGVAQARRGWLEARDVVNTRSWPELRELLSRRRPGASARGAA